MAEGFLPEDYPDEEAWPENWPACRLFLELCGQWRMASMGGPVAIDYGPLFARMERMRLSDDDWEDLFQSFREIESAALDQIRENAKTT